MVSAEYELGYIQAALPVLENYLLAENVYWTLVAVSPVGGPTYPNLTLGTLLLTLQKLRARNLSFDLQFELERAESMIGRQQSQWRSAWEKKSSQEFGARLRLWGNYLEDYRRDAVNNIDRYAYEVSRRVMLTLLMVFADPADEEREMLNGLDIILRSVFIPGSFIWEEVYASGFPEDQFWYLYGQLRGNHD